jgi:hypothetical protein
MKSESSNDSDIPLRRTLNRWRVEDPLPPGFEHRVWQRIEREEVRTSESGWAHYIKTFLEGFRRPALASSYIAVLLLAGLAAGYWQSRIDNEHARRELGARYVHMMDPYQRFEH